MEVLTIIILVQFISTLIVFRPVFREVLGGRSPHSWGDVVSGAFFTLYICVLVASLILVCKGIHRAFKAVTKGKDPNAAARLLAGESRVEKEKRRVREEQAAQRRIRALERELEIERGDS